MNGFTAEPPLEKVKGRRRGYGLASLSADAGRDAVENDGDTILLADGGLMVNDCCVFNFRYFSHFSQIVTGDLSEFALAVVM